MRLIGNSAESMNEDVQPWPPITFKVFSASGRFVGYGFDNGVDAYEVYLPGGDDEEYMGAISASDVEFSSGVVVGAVRESKIYYEDGNVAGMVDGTTVTDTEGNVIARIEGEASPEAIGGAVLLLVLCRWFLDSVGTPNPDVR